MRNAMHRMLALAALLAVAALPVAPAGATERATAASDDVRVVQATTGGGAAATGTGTTTGTGTGTTTGVQAATGTGTTTGMGATTGTGTTGTGAAANGGASAVGGGVVAQATPNQQQDQQPGVEQPGTGDQATGVVLVVCRRAGLNGTDGGNGEDGGLVVTAADSSPNAPVVNVGASCADVIEALLVENFALRGVSSSGFASVLYTLVRQPATTVTTQ